jgi:hypothetical protein
MTPSSTVPGCGGNTIDIVPIYPLVLIINRKVLPVKR